MRMFKKTIYDKLVTKVNDIDVSRFENSIGFPNLIWPWQIGSKNNYDADKKISHDSRHNKTQIVMLRSILIYIRKIKTLAKNRAR